MTFCLYLTACCNSAQLEKYKQKHHKRQSRYSDNLPREAQFDSIGVNPYRLWSYAQQVSRFYSRWYLFDCLDRLLGWRLLKFHRR
jgi:hypothetical protein